MLFIVVCGSEWWFFFELSILFQAVGSYLWLWFVVGTMMVSNKVCENGGEHVGLLPATNDDHGGVIVDIEEAMDAKMFVTLLRDSISKWRQEVVVSYGPPLQ